jgi:hypothetical protein
MKTSEMIAMLEKNKDLSFIRKCNGEKYALNDSGCLSRVGAYGVAANLRIDDEWTLVRTPVTWQEAIQAWSEGENIWCECGGCRDGSKCRNPIRRFTKISSLKDICKSCIANGIWHIGDADE